MIKNSIKPKLTLLQRNKINEIEQRQNQIEANDKRWQLIKLALMELGLYKDEWIDSTNEDNMDIEISLLYAEVTKLLRDNKDISYELKEKILRKTKPELFNPDGTVKVDISKLGNLK